MSSALLPASRRARLILGALAGAVALALAVSVGYFGPRFATPGDSSPEAGFARDMSQHHGQAVQMALYAYRLADNDEVRIMGYDIATTQQYQVGQMQTWLEDWRLSPNRSGPPMAWMPNGMRELQADGRMPGMASTAEVTKLSSSTGKDFDILFCQLLLRHHLGGVHMAQGILALTDDARVQTLAKAIIAGQQAEINILNNLLQQMGAKPLQ
jgi:uncharacterized protein (DUF305 family)